MPATLSVSLFAFLFIVQLITSIIRCSSQDCKTVPYLSLPLTNYLQSLGHTYAPYNFVTVHSKLHFISHFFSRNLFSRTPLLAATNASHLLALLETKWFPSGSMSTLLFPSDKLHPPRPLTSLILHFRPRLHIDQHPRTIYKNPSFPKTTVQLNYLAIQPYCPTR